MSDYPIVLQLSGRLCIVVGGGAVGLRKARGLTAAGARVRLIAPDLPADASLPENIEILARPYREGDLTGAFLAFAATAERAVNAAVAAEARSAGILVSVADAPQEGSFTLPALLRRGELSVAVSTGGLSPALAALLRDHLAERLGPEWGTVLEIAAALRRKRLTLPGISEYNQGVLSRLLDGGLPALIASKEHAAIDRLLKTLFGEGLSLAELGVHLPKGMT